MNLRIVYRGIKKIFADIRLEEDIRLFNYRTNNNVQSRKVSLKSIVGENITVLDGSYICENSLVDSYSFIGFNSLISKSVIGRYNSIASNVNIGHGEHPLDKISTNGYFIEDAYNTLTSRECIIESDVWIGVGSIIKRGVKVGVGAVVGANSFVNKDVPPFAIVVGSPARIIRYRFSNDKIAEILNSKWWDYEVKDAADILKRLEITTNGI